MAILRGRCGVSPLVMCNFHFHLGDCWCMIYKTVLIYLWPQNHNLSALNLNLNVVILDMNSINHQLKSTCVMSTMEKWERTSDVFHGLHLFLAQGLGWINHYLYNEHCIYGAWVAGLGSDSKLSKLMQYTKEPSKSSKESNYGTRSRYFAKKSIQTQRWKTDIWIWSKKENSF